MEITIWLSFVGTVAILGITPGPSVLLVAANSMNHGIKKTSGTILGDLSANLCQILLASLGLASIVIASGTLFQVIKWLGVLYLIYLGLNKIFKKPETGDFRSPDIDKSFWKLYVEGFLMSAANPKAIVFFAALFPLFINEHLPFVAQIVILAATFLVIDGISLLIYATFATRLKRFLEDRKKRYLQNRIVGLLLIFSGLMLSMVKRSNS